MQTVTLQDVSTLHVPAKGSHKGQNGRLLIIGGSRLFHAASIWALEVASRIVDLVHYSSVPENNEIVLSVKKEFHDGIVVPREDIEAYIEEDDSILIGPGMMRDEETKVLTHRLLTAYPDKQWIIDAGALQMLSLRDLPHGSILTPHHQEFAGLWQKALEEQRTLEQFTSDEERVRAFAMRYKVIVLLKGHMDVACSETVCRRIEGGNEGMTKGGTGDVLAGLVAALSCKNDPFEAVIAGSYINKKAGEALYKSVGPFYNASDLTRQIPLVMKDIMNP